MIRPRTDRPTVFVPFSGCKIIATTATTTIIIIIIFGFMHVIIAGVSVRPCQIMVLKIMSILLALDFHYLNNLRNLSALQILKDKCTVQRTTSVIDRVKDWSDENQTSRPSVPYISNWNGFDIQIELYFF